MSASNGGSEAPPSPARAQVDFLRDSWNHNARADPLFAVLAGDENHGTKWDLEAFFATGRKEVAGVFERLAHDGLKDRFGRALDFGCGVGRLSEALALRCDRVSAVDVAEVMVAKARELSVHKNVDYIVNVAPDLRIFEDGSFDFCMSHLVLQHVGRKLAKKYLREFVRLLSPGGVAEVEVPVGFRNVRGLFAAILPNSLLRIRGLWRRGMFFTTTFPIPPRSVERLIEEAGGRVVESRVLDKHPSAILRSYVFVKPPQAPGGVR